MKLPERHTKFSLSDAASVVAAPPLDSKAFRDAIVILPANEVTGFLRGYVYNRVPAAFAKQTMLWEALRDWVSLRLKVSPFEVGLTGSAQVGFSCVPDRYGQPFRLSKSDLDLFVVNESLFDRLCPELRKFLSASKVKFEDQRKTIERTYRRGFFDLKHVPSDHEAFPQCASINNTASMVVSKLHMHEIDLRHSFFRVYRSWQDFANQTQINFEALRKVANS